MSDKDICLKIFNLVDWRRYEDQGVFSGSEDDLRDGFIHLSYPDQTAATLLRYFAAHIQVVLGCVNLTVSDPFYRKERSVRGEIFPHYYDVLKKYQITNSCFLKRPEGTAWDEVTINSTVRSLANYSS